MRTTEQTAKPVAEAVAAERNPLVDPRPGDVVAAVKDDVRAREYFVCAVVGGIVECRVVGTGQTHGVWDERWSLDGWRNWPADWTVTVVRRGAP
jgi:hypothetical protein